MFAGKTGGVRGIILAGVHQWEGSSFERALPRPLLPVVHSPLICHGLRWLRDGGINNVTICANSASAIIRDYLGDGSRLGTRLDYYEDRTPRGPAGCLRDVIAHNDADVIVAADGALVPRIDLARLVDRHVSSGALATVVVGADRQNGHALEAGHTPAGIYVFQRRAFDDVDEAGYRDIKEVLIPRLHKRGERVVPYLADGPCLRVFGPATYLYANEWMLKRLTARGRPWTGYRHVARGLVHCSAQGASAANLVGPVLVGPETTIAEDAMIVGPTVIGAGCTIARNAVVCRSVIWDRCDIGKSSIVDRCILADEAGVVSGARLSYAVHVPAQSAVGSALRDLASRLRQPRHRGPGRVAVKPQIRINARLDYERL